MSQTIQKISSFFGEPTKLENGVTVYNSTGYDKPSGMCFGFVNGILYLGSTHHALIIYNLIEEGKADWDSLISAKQKWGWLRNSYGENPHIIIQLTSDEAAQSSDPGYAALLKQTIEEYYGMPAEYDENVGEEGYSNASEYGERSKVQYFGEGNYCDYCDQYYPAGEEEYHQHERYCEDCNTYYDPEYEDHSGPYCENCGDHVSYDHDQSHTPPAGLPKEGAQIYWKGNKYVVTDVDYEGFFVKPILAPGQTELPQWPNGVSYIYANDWFNANKTSSWQEDLWSEKHIKISRVALAHNVDLMDDRVFAILSSEYIKMANGGFHNWEDFVKDYSKATGMPYHEADQFNQYDDDWSVTRPDAGSIIDTHWQEPTYDTNNEPEWKALTPGKQPTQPMKVKDLTTPSYQGTMPPEQYPDDARLLQIVKDPSTLEYRWSYDGQQLHIWKVISRFSYGPSHYDMFGNEGYEKHSQGRVYVSEDGKVGVLYWQISHPECEQVLNEWVQKEFGKDPDYVYRAYGPYAGEVRPRWMFPIVEVSGLPISPRNRWWEQPGTTSPDWYSDDYLGIGTKKQKTKGYPAPKQKAIALPGPVDDNGNPVNPNKNKRRNRKRKRQRVYRNRSFGRR